MFPTELVAVAVPALLAAAALTFIARPAAVWLCTLGQGYAWRERTVLSAGGLKGAVPIVLATFPLTAGIDDAPLIFNVLFFVVLISVLMQGLALLPICDDSALSRPSPPGHPWHKAYPSKASKST